MSPGDPCDMVETPFTAKEGRSVPSSRREPVACGVDIGSTNVKVVALDPDGTVVARAGRPTPRDGHGLSIDGTMLVDMVDELVLEACADSFQARALCTVGVGEDGLLLDGDLRPLTPALAWFDPRRQGVLRALLAQLDDDEIFDAATDAARTMVGWLWARAQPGTHTARSWSSLADLPAVRWSRRSFLSDTLASRTGAWRASNRSWASDRVAMSLGSEELLPAVLAAGDIVGTVTSPALQAAGVVGPDTVVVAGGHDHPVGGWGVDQLVPGVVLDSMGTAEVVVTQSPLPPSAQRDQVDIAPGIGSTGTTVLRVLELARNVAWASQDPAVAHCIHTLLDGTARPEPLLEDGHFLTGRRGGNLPSYTLDAPRDPLAKASAVLGALACAGRDSVTAVAGQALSAGDHHVVRLAGGWARSPGWVEIKAAVNGYHAPSITEPEVTAVGAALLAATRLGWTADPGTALNG
jgi:sugar (pentulose or hexulose) kinase